MPFTNFDNLFIPINRFINFESHLVMTPQIKCVFTLSILIKSNLAQILLCFWQQGHIWFTKRIVDRVSGFDTNSGGISGANN